MPCQTPTFNISCITLNYSPHLHNGAMQMSILTRSTRQMRMMMALMATVIGSVRLRMF